LKASINTLRAQDTQFESREQRSQIFSPLPVHTASSQSIIHHHHQIGFPFTIVIGSSPFSTSYKKSWSTIYDSFVLEYLKVLFYLKQSELKGTSPTLHRGSFQGSTLGPFKGPKPRKEPPGKHRTIVRLPLRRPVLRKMEENPSPSKWLICCRNWPDKCRQGFLYKPIKCQHFSDLAIWFV
jgi:hypothetical protein